MRKCRTPDSNLVDNFFKVVFPFPPSLSKRTNSLQSDFSLANINQSQRWRCLFGLQWILPQRRNKNMRIYFVSWFAGRREAGESKKPQKGAAALQEEITARIRSTLIPPLSLLTDAESPQIYNSVHAKQVYFVLRRRLHTNARRGGGSGSPAQLAAPNQCRRNDMFNPLLMGFLVSFH